MIKRKNTGQLIIISAPSGAGKGSVISGLLERNKKNLWLSVSTTSRQPRSNDIPGVTYNFVSKDEFEKLIEEDYFLEYTNYVGNYYGTPKQAIKEKALVRCPKCGQAHCLAVSSGSKVYMMERQFSSNEFGIIAEFDSLSSQDFVNMCCKEDTDKQLYFEDLQALKLLDDKDFAVNNDIEIFCPVCHESNTFETWKDAFENPLKYFETEHLCDACGGEKLEKLIKKKKVYACDSCGLVSDFKET